MTEAGLAGAQGKNAAADSDETSDVEILLIEDDPDDVLIIERALKRAPIRIRTRVFHDGAAALAHLESSHEGGDAGGVSLVLLDLNMPVMDGHAFLKRLRGDDRFKALPAVVLTTSREDEVIQRAYRDGANAVISKADTLDGMMQAVDTIVRFWFQTSQRFVFGQ